MVDNASLPLLRAVHVAVPVPCLHFSFPAMYLVPFKLFRRTSPPAFSPPRSRVFGHPVNRSFHRSTFCWSFLRNLCNETRRRRSRPSPTHRVSKIFARHPSQRLDFQSKSLNPPPSLFLSRRPKFARMQPIHPEFPIPRRSVLRVPLLSIPHPRSQQSPPSTSHDSIGVRSGYRLGISSKLFFTAVDFNLRSPIASIHHRFYPLQAETSDGISERSCT